MIANEGVNVSAGSLGLLFEIHEQVHALSRTRPSIQDVTRLRQVGLPADPAKLRVHEPRALQDGHKIVVGAVNVADGPQHGARCSIRRSFPSRQHQWAQRSRTSGKQREH